MSLIFTVCLIAFTSALAYTTTKGVPTIRAGLVSQPLRALFEWIGAFAVFLVVNVTLGVVIIIAIRSLTQRFIAVYDVDSPLLLALSAVQGFVFQTWWSRD